MTSHEEKLLSDLKTEKEGAFENVYKAYYGSLLIAAYFHLKDQDQAKNVVQDLFLNLWEKKQYLTVRISLTSFLYVSLYNRCRREKERIIKERRKLERYINNSNLTESEVDKDLGLLVGDDVPFEYYQEKRRKRLLNACEQLSSKQYAAIQKIMMSNNSYENAADLLGVSKNTIKTTLKRAMANLRTLLASPKNLL